MINELYTLKEKYKNKKIYIWNINRNSINLFTMVAIRRINIQGFVSQQEKYIGEMFMNRPIVGIREAIQDGSAVILIDDDVSLDVVKELPRGMWVYWSEAIDINEELRQTKIIMYGTGYGAEQLSKVLEAQGIGIELYCVSKQNQMDLYNGKRIIDVTELEQYKGYAVIISVITESYKREILDRLLCFSGEIYLEYIIGEIDILHINLMQSIDFSIKNNKKIYFYSKKNALSKLLENVLSIYSIQVFGYVHEMEDLEHDIQNIYTIACDGTEDKLIIINEILPEELLTARENIELAGFSLEESSYTGIQWYTLSKEKMLFGLPEYHDPLVGGSILYPNGKPGWKMYGKEDEDKIRILVLGGSTSSEEYHPENWVSKLHYKMEKKNIHTVIYNGAHVCNDIVDEILRLMRDGYALSPQIVISMSGVNNLHYKDSANQFNEERLISWVKTLSTGKYCSGVYSDELLYDFWNRNMQLLKKISRFFGADFYGFLQPINMAMSHMSLREKSIFEREAHIMGAKQFEQLANHESGYINLMKMFEHQHEMYFDMCHYTEKAHEIIAEKVFEAIMPTIEMLK